MSPNIHSYKNPSHQIRKTIQPFKMGTLPQAQPTIQDLKVTYHDCTSILPTHQFDEQKSLFLSNIDQVLNFHVPTVHFFSANPDYPLEIVVTRLKNALNKLLVTYEFLAGSLNPNQQTGRLEISCRPSGLGFVLAASEYSLDEVGDLVYPNPAFMQLILPSMDKFDYQPLFVMQVTSFKCGGFAIGVSNNHILLDGMSFKAFLENLASQCFDDKPLASIPCHDRHLLAARSPPQVTFPHVELLKLKLPIGEEPPPVFDAKQDDLEFKIFELSSKDINHLKVKAKIEGSRPAKKITGFNVITAHVWRCKALSFDDENNRDRESTILFAVDIRSRLNPPLPLSYCGNAVLSAYASAKCSILEDEPFSEIVDLVLEGAERITDEYARSAIDWGEVYKGFPNGEFLISSWWRLGFDEVEYPWGKPKYSCPVVHHRKDIILLFPEIGAMKKDEVNVLVALPPKEMQKFKSYWQKFLA